MNTFYNLIIVVQVLSALAIIALVLLQHGKGADMGAAFGSGASGSLFGASGSSNFMSKSTAVAAVVFFSSTLALASMATANRGGSTGGGLLDKVTVPVETKGTGAIPTAPSADAGVPAPTAGVPAPAAAPAAPTPAPAPAQPK